MGKTRINDIKLHNAKTLIIKAGRKGFALYPSLFFSASLREKLF
jgi:hypothetical protein